MKTRLSSGLILATTALLLLGLNACAASAPSKDDPRSALKAIEEAAEGLARYDFPETVDPVLEMPKPTRGLARCKGDCSVHFEGKLVDECKKYCDCAYKFSRPADIVNGSPTSFFQELFCRVDFINKGGDIEDR